MEVTGKNQSIRKRQRTIVEDAEPPLSNSDITKSAEFWFHDGSVVLQAQSTQFRVHMTVLSLHSTVFRDMFSMPQPAEAELTIEGCPIVHVSDTAQDVGFMFHTLYKLVPRFPLSLAAEFWNSQQDQIEKEAKILYYLCPASSREKI